MMAAQIAIASGVRDSGRAAAGGTISSATIRSAPDDAQPERDECRDEDKKRDIGEAAGAAFGARDVAVHRPHQPCAPEERTAEKDECACHGDAHQIVI